MEPPDGLFVQLVLYYSAAPVTGTCKSSVIMIFCLFMSIVLSTFFLRDVPVEHNSQYLLLSSIVCSNKLLLLQLVSLCFRCVCRQILAAT